MTDPTRTALDVNTALANNLTSLNFSRERLAKLGNVAPIAAEVERAIATISRAQALLSAAIAAELNIPTTHAETTHQQLSA